MKPLRNPWVTGALAIVAVAVVWYQLFPRHFNSLSAVGQPPTTQVVTSGSPRDTASKLNLSSKSTAPEMPIDRDYVQAHLTSWIAAPSHDPFQLLVPISAHDTNAPPWAHWQLKAIWRQQSGNFAAINHGIYGVGDTIDGYKIERIEEDQVWLQGPKLRERLTFDTVEVETESVLPPATNTTNQASPEKPEPPKPQ